MISEHELKSMGREIDKLVWTRGDLRSRLGKCERALRIVGRQIAMTEEAQTILRKVAIKTQERIKLHISDLVTAAIQSVMPEDKHYALEVNFVEKRGAVECEFSLKRGEGEREIFGVGGGIIDIISLALRPCILVISGARRTIILDEPFRNLRIEHHKKASALLKQLSEELKLQLIVVSHTDELIKSADKVIEIRMVDGVSSVAPTLRRATPPPS